MAICRRHPRGVRPGAFSRSLPRGGLPVRTRAGHPAAGGDPALGLGGGGPGRKRQADRGQFGQLGSEGGLGLSRPGQQPSVNDPDETRRGPDSSLSGRSHRWFENRRRRRRRWLRRRRLRRRRLRSTGRYNRRRGWLV